MNEEEKDVIDLDCVDTKAMKTKIRKIIKDIEKTGDYLKYRGKRLAYDRTLISIPLYDYRLLYRDENGVLIPIEVVSHNNYDGISRKKRK